MVDRYKSCANNVEIVYMSVRPYGIKVPKIVVGVMMGGMDPMLLNLVQ